MKSIENDLVIVFSKEFSQNLSQRTPCRWVLSYLKMSLAFQQNCKRQANKNKRKKIKNSIKNPNNPVSFFLLITSYSIITVVRKLAFVFSSCLDSISNFYHCSCAATKLLLSLVSKCQSYPTLRGNICMHEICDY